MRCLNKINYQNEKLIRTIAVQIFLERQTKSTVQRCESDLTGAARSERVTVYILCMSSIMSKYIVEAPAKMQQIYSIHGRIIEIYICQE